MKTEIPNWVTEYNNAGHQSSAAKAVKILMTRVSELENGWISVEEKLPESNVQVLCIGNKGKHQFVGFYTVGRDVEVAPDEDYSNDCEDCQDQDYCYLKPGWYEEEETPRSEYDYQYVSRDVTHWQPLPSPPKQ